MTDRERLLAELRGDPLRSRDKLRERMESLAARPRQHRRVDNVTIHETTPNVGVARPLSKAQNDGLKAVDLIRGIISSRYPAFGCMALHCRHDGDRAPNRHDWAERISKPYIIMHGTLVCWAAFGSIRPAIARPPSFQRQPFSTPICKEWSGSELGGPQRSRPDWPFREVVGLDLGAPSSRAGGGRRRQQGRGLHRQAATGAQGRWAEQVDEVLEAHPRRRGSS